MVVSTHCFHHLICVNEAGVGAETVNDEEKYRELCTAHCADFVRLLLETLPRETTDQGVVGLLDPIHKRKFALPRALPIPKHANEPVTKWKKFAKAKRLAPKSDRSRLTYDEASHSYRLRFGGRSKRHEEAKRDVIIEHKPGMKDPFAERNIERNATRARQQLREIQNKAKKSGVRLR